MCWGSEREHGPASSLRHLPGYPPLAGDDLWHTGVHIQGLDQVTGYLRIPGIYCALQVSRSTSLAPVFIGLPWRTFVEI